MRKKLLHDPLLLIERIGQWATKRRRLKRLRNSAASGLSIDHIDSLELLELLSKHNLKVVYDIGANTGTWSRLASSILPHIEIHAFEPLKSHIQEFHVRTKGMDRITLHEIALGERSGNASVHRTSSTDASSILPLSELGADYYCLTELDTVEVSIDSLDNLTHTLDLPQPDLIKLDIQGYELNALRGAIKTLAKTRAVIAEVSFVEIYKGQCLFHEIVEFLAANDLYLSSVGHGIKAGTNLMQADLLFTKTTQ